MTGLTKRQREVLDFIRECQATGVGPSLREIARHFSFRSMNAAVTHVGALRKKGLIENHPRQARALRLVAGARGSARRTVSVPLLGTIPAGWAQVRGDEDETTLTVDATLFGAASAGELFALVVRGDSMIERNILDGDVVVLRRGTTPRVGDVVAALIDQESTLKVYVVERGQPMLRAANRRYPDLRPCAELTVEGVMAGLIRRCVEGAGSP